MPPPGGFGKKLSTKRVKAKAKAKKFITPPDQVDRSRAGQLARSKRAAGDAPQDRAKDTKRATKFKKTQKYVDQVQETRGDRHPQGKAKGREAQQLIDAAYFERNRRVSTGAAKAGPGSQSAKTDKVKDQPRTDKEIRKYLINGKAVYSTPIVHSTPDQRDRTKATRDKQLEGSKVKAGDKPQNRNADQIAASRFNKAHPIRTQQQEHVVNIEKARAAGHTKYAGPPGGKVFEKIGKAIGSGGKHATLKTLEVVSRPSHAIAGAADEVVKGHSPVKVAKEAGKGLTGHQTTNFAKVLKDAKVLRSHNTIRNVVGFGLDVGTDPTTYVTFGAGGVLRKGAEEAARAARVAARKAGKSVEEQEVAAKAAHDAHMAHSKDPANKGIQGGVRVPFTGRKLVTSGKTTARINRRAGGSKLATKIRQRPGSQKLGRALDPDFRPGDVPDALNRSGRRAARRHRAHNDRAQERAENLRTSIERETGGRRGKQARKDITAAVEKAPDRGSIPDTHVQLENTARHEARIARGKAGRGREKARRDYAEAKGRAVNEDRHAVSERVMAPERAANAARDTAQRQLRTAGKQSKAAEREVRKVVLKHDQDYQDAAKELRDLQRERATWRTRYGNEARSNNPKLNSDTTLAARAKILEDLDKKVAAAQAKVHKAADAAEAKPIPAAAAKRADDAIKAGSRERDATRVADDATDVAHMIRKDRATRREFETDRGVPAPHLDNLQTTLGALKQAEGAVRKADDDIKATAATPKKRELVRRVVGGFAKGHVNPQGSLLTGDKYSDIRDALPKQASAHPEVVANLRARNQRIGATELKRGKLDPNQALSEPALARYKAGTLKIDDVKPTDIRDDYMHHELPEVVSPVRTGREASKKLKEVDEAIDDVSNRLLSAIPGSAKAQTLTTHLERLTHQKDELERLRAGMAPSAPMSAAKGANTSFRQNRTIRHSASEENAFRDRDARMPLFEEDAAKLQAHRELQHDQMEGWSDFVDAATEHGIPWKIGDSVPPGHALYYRDASDHLKEISAREKEKFRLPGAKVPDNTMVLNKTHIQRLLSEAERQGKIPSAWTRKVVAPWKVAYTVANVSYHVGNELGNRVLAWMADVGPQAWAQSHSYLRVIRKRNAFEKEGKAARGEQFADALSKGDQAKLAELELAEKSGALRSGLHQEISNLRGKQPGAFRRFSERREMQARIAVWNQARREGMGPDEAADRVNKFLIDYGNLTDFEKKVRDVGIPFYTFWARNTRLQLGQLAQRPGKAATFQKAREDVAQAQNEDPKFADALQRYQQAGAPFIIMLNGSPVLFFAKSPIEQGLSTPGDLLKGLNGLAHGKPGDFSDFGNSLISRLGPQKIPFEAIMNYKSFQRKPISDKTNPGQAGLEAAPSWADGMPPFLQKAMGVVKDTDGKVFWNAGMDYAVNNIPYGKTVTDATTPKDSVNQYGQKPWMSVASGLGAKVSTGDPRYIKVQQAYEKKTELEGEIARMVKLKTAWRQLTPSYRVQTPEYRKLLDEQAKVQEVIDGDKKEAPTTLSIPKTRAQQREEYLKNRKVYDPKEERRKYLEKRKAQKMLRGG